MFSVLHWLHDLIIGLKCVQLKGCKREGRKLRVSTRTCKYECEMRVTYTNHSTTTNVCTETIGFTTIRKIVDEHELVNALCWVFYE